PAVPQGLLAEDRTNNGVWATEISALGKGLLVLNGNNVQSHIFSDTVEGRFGTGSARSSIIKFPNNIHAETEMYCNSTAGEFTYDKMFGYVEITVSASRPHSFQSGALGGVATAEITVPAHDIDVNFKFSNGQRIVGARFNGEVKFMDATHKIMRSFKHSELIGMAGFHGAVERYAYGQTVMTIEELRRIEKVTVDLYLTHISDINGSAGATCDPI
uniref:hypothetical protein n=1 Tax=Paracoccus sp. PAMC 22219 TaxID=1569209 RepID=UPI0018CCC971